MKKTTHSRDPGRDIQERNEWNQLGTPTLQKGMRTLIVELLNWHCCLLIKLNQNEDKLKVGRDVPCSYIRSSWSFDWNQIGLSCNCVIIFKKNADGNPFYKAQCYSNWETIKMQI